MHSRGFKAAVALLFGLQLAGRSFAWSGRLHEDITRAACRALDEEMPAWSKYAKVLAPRSVDPDLWKGSDLREHYRHYVDVEGYAPLAITNFPRNLAQAKEMARKKKHLGEGPWVVMELQERLTEAMRMGQWTNAAQLAAAQAHYASDLHQPLHTTSNFDGRDTGQEGVHLRWEVEMGNYFWRVGMMPEIQFVYVSNVWAALLGWIAEAHERIPEIYAADDWATRKVNFNIESRLYLYHLWQASSNLFVEQVHRAAQNLASLWYTAWVDAGRPPIASPPSELSQASLWAKTSLAQEHPSWPFLVLFGGGALVILVLSLRPRRRAETTADPGGAVSPQ